MSDRTSVQVTIRGERVLRDSEHGPDWVPTEAGETMGGLES